MEFLDVPLLGDDVFRLTVRFLFNIAFLIPVLRLAIAPGKRGNRDFAFTAAMMNVMVFFICFTLKKLEIQLGMAIGLFAIFGVLRYRTDAIRTKEMTYLFIVIGLAVINSLSNSQTSYAELVLVNCMILFSCMLMENLSRKPQKSGKKDRSQDAAQSGASWKSQKEAAEITKGEIAKGDIAV